MSRTRHHGRKGKIRLFADYHSTVTGEPGTPKLKRHREEWNWMNTPGWWVKEFMTVSWRAKGHRLERAILRLNDIEDCPIFPDDRKPHLYYW